PAGRAGIDIAGVLLFLFPLCAFIFYESFDYVAASWSMREGGRAAGGLPSPMIPLLNSVLLLMPLLVWSQGFALSLTSLRTMREDRSGAREPGLCTSLAARAPNAMAWVALLLFAAVIRLLWAGFHLARTLAGPGLAFARARVIGDGYEPAL